MTKKFIPMKWFATFVLAGITLCDVANAQFFTAGKSDLLAGFRITSGAPPYELVVNLGSVTNLIKLNPGTTINISSFSPAQLSAAFSSYGRLQWSVAAGISGSASFAGYHAQTIWYTLPRTDVNTQTSAQSRYTSGNQTTVKNQIISVGNGAHTISVNLGTTNANNNSVLVREPSGDTVNGLSAQISDLNSDPTYGNYRFLPFSVENITPASFTTAQRSDLYQSVPTGQTDPTTGQTTGNAYYIGYFQFNPDGTMTFTRASATSNPPAPVLTIQRSGTNSTISFLTTSGATYTLCFTNSAGLRSAISTWPTSVTNITGDGATRSFTDTTATSDRFYSVRAQ